jgi:hypothetical protein
MKNVSISMAHYAVGLALFVVGGLLTWYASTMLWQYVGITAYYEPGAHGYAAMAWTGSAIATVGFWFTMRAVSNDS